METVRYKQNDDRQHLFTVMMTLSMISTDLYRLVTVDVFIIYDQTFSPLLIYIIYLYTHYVYIYAVHYYLEYSCICTLLYYAASQTSFECHMM